MSPEITAVSMETICADVVKAATSALKAHGFERAAVVVNFAWKEPVNGMTYAIGTVTPKRYRALLADSLAQSAEDARL